MDIKAKGQKLDDNVAAKTYPNVPTIKTTVLNRKDKRRPKVSAKTPVGISKTAMLPL